MNEVVYGMEGEATCKQSRGGEGGCGRIGEPQVRLILHTICVKERAVHTVVSAPKMEGQGDVDKRDGGARAHL
jgi:hypothetical protein